jgi:hypothetical protein
MTPEMTNRQIARESIGSLDTALGECLHALEQLEIDEIEGTDDLRDEIDELQATITNIQDLNRWI